jgi:hypothetical protein
MSFRFKRFNGTAYEGVDAEKLGGNLPTNFAKAQSLNDAETYTTVESAFDSNGVCTEIDHKRADGTLILKSILSGGTSPQYTTRTETRYDTDGITVLKTTVYTQQYNSDGIPIGEVINV